MKFLLLRCRITLVATNNFSEGRFNDRKLFLKLSYFLLNPCIERIVVHTQHEKYLVNRHLKYLKKKVFIKRHHLMIVKDNLPKILSKQVNISFFGPVKAEKPLDPICKLIKDDKTGDFIYKFYNVTQKDAKYVESQTSELDNVKFHFGWLDKNEFQEAIDQSDILFLSHQASFQGKLSGNLCDAIANKKPYISAEMEPMTTLNSKYGEVGFLVDFKRRDWSSNLVAKITKERLSEMAMQYIAYEKEFTQLNVYQDLEIVFGEECRIELVNFGRMWFHRLRLVHYLVTQTSDNVRILDNLSVGVYRI